MRKAEIQADLGPAQESHGETQGLRYFAWEDPHPFFQSPLEALGARSQAPEGRRTLNNPNLKIGHFYFGWTH